MVDTLIVSYSTTKETNENLSMDEYKSFFEGNVNDAVGEKIDIHPDFFERYDHHAREIKVPKVIGGLTKELSKKYILVIVSSTGTSSIKKILERENVSENFSDILGNDIETSKVKKIKMMLEKYNTNPDNSIFVTDTLGDILEARKCGVKSLAVTWGFHNRKTIERGNPLAIIDAPKDLFDSINKALK